MRAATSTAAPSSSPARRSSARTPRHRRVVRRRGRQVRLRHRRPQARMPARGPRRRRGCAVEGARYLRAACRHRRRHHQAGADRQRRDRRARGFRGRRPFDRYRRRRRLDRIDRVGASSSRNDLGIAIAPESSQNPEIRHRIARRLAEVAADMISGTPLDALGRSLLLTEPLPRLEAPTALHFGRRRRIRVRPREQGNMATSPNCWQWSLPPSSAGAPACR